MVGGVAAADQVSDAGFAVDGGRREQVPLLDLMVRAVHLEAPAAVQ